MIERMPHLHRSRACRKFQEQVQIVAPRACWTYLFIDAHRRMGEWKSYFPTQSHCKTQPNLWDDSSSVRKHVLCSEISQQPMLRLGRYQRCQQREGWNSHFFFFLNPMRLCSYIYAHIGLNMFIANLYLALSIGILPSNPMVYHHFSVNGHSWGFPKLGAPPQSSVFSLIFH